MLGVKHFHRLPLAFAGLLVAVTGGVIGAAAYALLLGENEAPGRGSIIHFGRSFSEIEETPFCVPLQHFCLIQLDSGELRALYSYDTHSWSRERNCEIAWRPDMLFTDPDTRMEARGWFRSGCSGTTYRYNGERVFGPGLRDMDEFPVEEKTLVERTPDGQAITSDYIEVDTRKLICGKVADPTVRTGCERAPHLNRP
jgi:hypothetical protein